MRRFITLIAAGMSVSLLQSAFISALPAPLNGIILVPMAAVWLIMSFRFHDALALAVVAGLTSDLLRPFPFGMSTAVAVASTLALAAVFTRVFTNLSPLIYALLQAAGWAAFRLLSAAAAFLDSLLLGTQRADRGGLVAIIVGVSLQVIVAAAALFAGRAIRSRVGKLFLIRKT